MKDTKDFYKSARWKRTRAAILRRDKYLCRRCKRYGRTRAANTVHHIKEMDEYPELALDHANLEAICAACHNALHPDKGGCRT